MMRSTILSILFIGGLLGGASFPEQAAEKAEAGDHATAIALYDSAAHQEDYLSQRYAIAYNRGQSYLQLDSLSLASSFFSHATGLDHLSNISNPEKQLLSWSWNNIGYTQIKERKAPQMQGSSPMASIPGMGNMNNAGGQGPSPEEIFGQALQSFKKALMADPDNETARFNYELLMRQRQKAEQEKKDEDQEKKDQSENQDDQKDNQDKSEEEDQQKKDDKQEGNSDSNKEPDNQENKGNQPKNNQKDGQASESMPAEQAKQLLEAINEKEKQFIQQLERGKKKKGRPKRNDGPDW